MLLRAVLFQATHKVVLLFFQAAHKAVLLKSVLFQATHKAVLWQDRVGHETSALRSEVITAKHEVLVSKTAIHRPVLLLFQATRKPVLPLFQAKHKAVLWQSRLSKVDMHLDIFKRCEQLDSSWVSLLEALLCCVPALWSSTLLIMLTARRAHPSCCHQWRCQYLARRRPCRSRL